MNTIYERGSFLVLLTLSIGVSFVSAQQIERNVESNVWHLSIEGDYFGVGNANSTIQSSNICTLGVASYGATSCSVSTKASGAEGVRAGFFHDYKGLEFGPSFGYLNGGPGVGIADVQFNGVLNKVRILSTANTMRFLGEARQTWFLSRSFGARVGAGLGIAVENRSTSYALTNTALSQFELPDYSSFGWLTWELSPTLVYKGVNLGLRYVGFGRGGQIPWNTFGAFFGVDF